MEPATTLDRVRPGTAAHVVRVDGGDALARRLSDVGFWPGVCVTVVRRAPFGDPVEYLLHNYRLALRGSEARRVVVTT